MHVHRQVHGHASGAVCLLRRLDRAPHTLSLTHTRHGRHIAAPAPVSAAGRHSRVRGAPLEELTHTALPSVVRRGLWLNWRRRRPRRQEELQTLVTKDERLLLPSLFSAHTSERLQIYTRERISLNAPLSSAHPITRVDPEGESSCEHVSATASGCRACSAYVVLHASSTHSPQMKHER